MPVKTDKGSIWDYYKKRLDYQQSMGFSSKWNELINMKEGIQWPAVTPKTKYMPRPVINQCDFIIENKQSNILSQTLKLVYSPDEVPEGQDISQITQQADNFTDAADTTWHDIEQEVLNEECVDDVLTIGTGIFHYYFDNNESGGMFTPYKGKIKGEIIDPEDIFFENPKGKPREINKQGFIILRNTLDTDIVVEMAKQHKGEHLLVTADSKGNSNENYDNAKKEVTDSQLTTVLTMYFRKDGEIYWTKVTEGAVVVPPTRLSPIEKKFTIYPIVVTVFKPRKKCIYGRSIIEDIIPNQKALNWGLGMMLLSVQQTAWPKIIAKVGALTQSITNEPGEIIEDHFSSPGVDGIKYMQPPNFSNTPVMLADKLLDLTRQVTGTTEVTSGEVQGANMAAAAIIALQNQAKKPNERYQNVLFRSIKNIGRIWEEFYKTYYNLERPIKSKDNEGNEVTKKFTGTDSADTPFGLKVDVGPASVFSESLQMTVLDQMAQKQWINKFQYVKYAPSNIVPSALKQDFEKEEEQMMQMQKMQQNAQTKANDIMNKLPPEERAELEQNPQLLDQTMAQMGGGQGGMQGMQ